MSCRLCPSDNKEFHTFRQLIEHSCEEEIIFTLQEKGDPQERKDYFRIDWTRPMPATEGRVWLSWECFEFKDGDIARKFYEQMRDILKEYYRRRDELATHNI